jgi:alpha-tubulin suppressor-like RCC1 family protein
MKISLARRRLRMVKHAVRSVLVMAAASLLFSCGNGSATLDPKPAVDQARVSTKSLSLSLSPVAQCSDVATIAAGMYHTVGLKEDGTVVAAGFNGYGQMNVSSWTNIKAVAAGAFHTVGLKEDGTVVAAGYTAGYNSLDQTNVSSWTNIKAVAAGIYHTVGLKEDGTVVAVGFNGNGQTNVSSWTNIKSVAAGMYHTVGLKEDGTVVAVGHNGYGQLNVSSWTNIKAIAAGAYHTVGLKDDGTVVAVGHNGYGQLDVSSWTNIKAVAAGLYHTVGLKEDGTVAAVGHDGYGQLDISSWTKIEAFAAGAYHTVGLKEDGTVVAAGFNGYGQLNVSTWTNIMPLCDVTPPITTAMVTGTLGNNGWYVSDVQITLTAIDGGSGVKEIHYTVDGTETVVPGSSALHAIVGDGTHTVTWHAIDNAGNVEPPREMSITIDKTPPTITTTVSPGPNANGWNNTNVTVTFTCSDSLSGIASCPAPIAVTTEGAGQEIIDTAVDKAGNSATARVTLNIDKTPPSTPSLSASPSILWPPNHKMVKVLIGGAAADSGSGIASTIITVTDEYGIYNMTVPGFGSVIRLESWRKGTDRDGRLYTITAVTTDKAGNRSTGTTTVLVPHDMGGFFNERDDDELDYGEDHHERGHHDRHHGSGHYRDDRDDGL